MIRQLSTWRRRRKRLHIHVHSRMINSSMHSFDPLDVTSLLVSTKLTHARIYLNLLLDLVIAIAPLPGRYVGVLQRSHIVPLLIESLLVQDVDQSLPLAVERVLAIVSPLVGHYARHGNVLDFIPLHLHLNPLVVRVPVQHQRGHR